MEAKVAEQCVSKASGCSVQIKARPAFGGRRVIRVYNPDGLMLWEGPQDNFCRASALLLHTQVEVRNAIRADKQRGA